MQYQEIFSKVYQKEWGSYPIKYAEKIRAHIQDMQIKTALDLCCGTGHLTRELAKQGIKCMGLDLSPHQIRQANKNKSKLKIHYQVADASSFRLNKKFDLITCTYDSLNHLQNEKQLGSCFACAHRHIHKNGYFIFDLNTEMYLQKGWDRIFNTTHTDDLFMINNGQYLDDEKRAFIRVIGFVRKGKTNTYEKFDEKIFNTAFSMKKVISFLRRSGFKDVHCYNSMEFTERIPLSKLEEQRRVYFVARG